jgi:predicted dehydrogenase
MNWGILGLGEIAARNVAPGLAEAEGSRLHAVCSRDIAKANAFAARFGATRAYASYDDMLADRDLHAIYIATPNTMHAAQTVLAARSGKHVLCEKPMATSIADAEDMIVECEKHDVALGVVFQHRYHPAHVRARAIISSGVLGGIQFASAQLCRGFERSPPGGWRTDATMSGAGAIVAQAVHPIDFLRYAMNSEVVRVHAMSDEQPPDRLEDMVYALLEFASGARAMIVAGWLLPRFDNDVLFYGARAKIVLRGTLGVPAGKDDGELSVEGEISCNGKTSYSSVHGCERVARMVEEFVRSASAGREPDISGRNGLQMVKIADAMQRSSRLGQSIRID